MKLRVFFLRRSYILYLLILALLLLLVLVFVNFFKKDSNQVFNIVEENKTIKTDLTGDGLEDILYIKKEKDKYSIQVNSKDQSFLLSPDKKLNTIGTYSDHWPMKITFKDITRDKIPEIFIQSSTNNNPIQHIFMWTGKNFKDIYCSSNNIIGFIDSENNKTPKFISGNLSSNKLIFSYNMAIGNNMQNISYDADVPGKYSVYSFIRYIESLPDGESNKPKDIFYDSMDGKALSPIGKLCAENNIYYFQDAVFMDTKFNTDGVASEIKWILNFRGVSKGDGISSKLYTLTIKLKINGDSSKIYSIQLE